MLVGRTGTCRLDVEQHDSTVDDGAGAQLHRAVQTGMRGKRSDIMCKPAMFGIAPFPLPAAPGHAPFPATHLRTNA